MIPFKLLCNSVRSCHFNFWIVLLLTFFPFVPYMLMSKSKFYWFVCLVPLLWYYYTNCKLFMLVELGREGSWPWIRSLIHQCHVLLLIVSSNSHPFVLHKNNAKTKDMKLYMSVTKVRDFIFLRINYLVEILLVYWFFFPCQKENYPSIS